MPLGRGGGVNSGGPPPSLGRAFCTLFSFARIKGVRANCFCASLLRAQIHMPRHASSARAKY